MVSRTKTTIPPSDLAAPGQVAPDFTLPDTHGTPVQLSARRGAPVLVVFFPFAFSRLCHQELTGLNEQLDTFAALGAEVLAVSCDPVHSLRAWGDQEGFGLTLLSDFWPHGRVADAYGAFDDEAGHAGRGSVLIDANGTIAWTTLSPPGRTRSLTEHVDAVRALAAARVEEP